MYIYIYIYLVYWGYIGVIGRTILYYTAHESTRIVMGVHGNGDLWRQLLPLVTSDDMDVCICLFISTS